MADRSHLDLDAEALSSRKPSMALAETAARTLWLHGNRIGPAGARVLAEALEEAAAAAQPVRRLTLSGNGFGTEGVGDLLSGCLAASGHLIALGLGLNGAGHLLVGCRTGLETCEPRPGSGR